MNEWPKKYDPQEHEPAIYRRWEEADAFKPKGGKPFRRADKKPFVIMLPLPNITGNLHMGHALQHTIMDVLIRYHRMKGDPTLWQPGTDHAGIATQNVVEKSLRAEGISRHDLGRDKFIAKVWAWRDKYGHEIVAQMKRLGSSCDWSRSVFTMDEKYVTAVYTAFIRYFQKGYIYRGNRLVNWCPRCSSVISDLEIKHQEQDGTLYTLRYPLSDELNKFISIATTRPETMLGDTAVAVNPADQRYSLFIGRSVTLPLINRTISIIADERVDVTFGTGAVKVTPAHDPLDAEIGTTHKLPAINVIGEDGKMTAAANEFAGLTIDAARQEIIAALQQQGALVSAQPYRHTVTVCDRCGTLIEPLISRQWFVAMNKLKAETVMAATDGLVKFFPPRWQKNFLDWMNNVHDWTISRQLWWGQRIPVWWKSGARGTEQEEGNYVVSVDKPADGGVWEQDPDVFDTWFSSALWPMATLGWPVNTDDLKNFYPTSVLISARDILYLWIARMIFSGLELMQGEQYDNRNTTARIPFEHVFIHPTVLTKTGQRMSKSLGTGLDPLELVNKYGADAVRFGLLYQMSYDNQAIKFDEEAVKSARNFANKIWNIARLLASLPDRQDKATPADKWITYRVQTTVSSVTVLLEQYKTGEAAHVLYDYIWSDYAAWYAEIIKVEGSLRTARENFSTILRLLHPFMPHLTELIWSFSQHDSMLILSDWPAHTVQTTVSPAIEQMDRFKGVVTTIRSVRAILQLPAAVRPGLWLGDEVVLPSALVKIAHVNLAGKKKSDMVRFPLPSSGSIYMGSPEITGDRLTAARTKLKLEQKRVEGLIEKSELNLSAMRGRAPRAVVADKKKDLNRLRSRLQEIKNSYQLLT